MIIQSRRSILQGLMLSSFVTTHTVKGVQFCLNKGSCLSPKRDNSKELKYIDGILQYSSPVPLCQLHN